MSCFKDAGYFLSPQDVSFHGIMVHEGDGPQLWLVGTILTNAGAFTTQVVLSNGQTNSITNYFFDLGSHTAGDWTSPLHLPYYPSGPVKPNYWGQDSFGLSWSPTNSGLPVLEAHTPTKLFSSVSTIKIEYTFATASTFLITNRLATFDLYSSGRITIDKGGSGPHTKEYADPDSP